MNRLSVYDWWAALSGAAGTTLLIFAISAAKVQAQQPAPARGDIAPAGNVAKGKQAFKQFGCYACHGFSGHGGLSPAQRAGPRVATNPRPFPAFVSYVRQPAGRMPAYGNQITDAELADIYAFLKSVPPSPDPKNISLLNDD